jgi:cell division protease FtsH
LFLADVHWELPGIAEERQITTKEQMLDEMCATLGGRAAEDLILAASQLGHERPGKGD